MRKYIYITLSLLSFSFIWGCKKDLNKYPYDALETSQALETPEDFTNAIRGIYVGMIRDRSVTANAAYYGKDWILLQDAMADNLIICTAGRLTKSDYHNWRYASNNTTTLFVDAYLVIQRANAIVENIDKLTAGDFKNNALGEALAVRALSHFDLLRTYGKLKYNGGGLGVPYVTSTNPDLLPTRESVKDNYDKIVKDLEAAESLIATSNGIGRLNKPAVTGLLARVNLYKEDWQKTIDAATRSLAVNNNVGSIAKFPGIWSDETEEGVLFKVLITDKDRVTVGVAYSQASSTGIRSEYVADYDLFTKYKGTDVRKSAYFQTSLYNGTTYNHIAKYLGRKTGNKNVLDVKVIRVAEVLLSRAEAYYKSGKETDALTDLNALRSQRYTGFVNGTETGAQLEEAIALERRLELAFEGDRFFDLKRKGLPVVRSDKGDQADGSGPSNNEKLLPANNYKFQLPIPLQELNTNKNMVQNEGY